MYSGAYQLSREVMILVVLFGLIGWSHALLCFDDFELEDVQVNDNNFLWIMSQSIKFTTFPLYSSPKSSIKNEI